MKKLLLLMTVGLIALAGCSSNNIMSGYPNLKEKNHHFVTKQYTDIMTDMENKVPGVYYFGFPDCPWCQILVPELEPILAENDVTAMTVDIRNKQFQNNSVLQERFDAFLKTFPAGIANEKGSVPFLIVIGTDGSIDGHIGVHPDYVDRSKPLTDEQRDYLSTRLGHMFQKTK